MAASTSTVFVGWLFLLYQYLPPPILMRLMGSSLVASAFTHQNVMGTKTTGINARIIDATALFARSKNVSARKVPKMPTLPVSTSTSSTTSEEEDSYYSSDSTPPKPTSISTMVVMDVENIRGATSFRISHEALLSRIRLWREDRLSMASQQQQQQEQGEDALLEPLIWICDHGMAPSIHHFPKSDGDNEVAGNNIQMPHNFGAAFAGPSGRTADDVIVNLVTLRCGGRSTAFSDDDDDDDDLQATIPSEPQPMNSHYGRNSTIVITADARLISRCQQARRKSSSLSDVIFVEPASLLQQLERYRINTKEEERIFGENESPKLTMSPPSHRNKALDKSSRQSNGKTSTMSSFKDSSIAMEQHAKFQARFQNKKGLDVIEEKPSDHSKENEADSDAGTDEDDSSSAAAALAAQLKTEQIRRQLLLSDAYYLARPSKNVRGRRAHTTVAAVHAKYKTRNISKKQQKRLYAKRFGRKRNEDMVQAAVKRKELAAKLQLNLRRASTPDSCEEDDTDDSTGGVCLLEKLLENFEKERLRRSHVLSNFDGNDDSRLTTAFDPTALGLDGTSGRVGSDDKFDPLGSTLTIPLRDMQISDKNLPPLRMVVISDTHGFEGALSRFSTASNADSATVEDHHSKIHSDDSLLPQADVLLHCGDFAASGSRKTQRAAARRLDEFLARQTHIPEKVVVQGNHDPDSPAKVLFPNSKALYVRSSSTLMINGVSFTLEPFSRRMAFRSIRRRTSSYALPSLSQCDVFVSHEPPRGVLDLTYHGFSAGSLYLRELVEHAEEKPRLWLCGHIHESRGVTTQQFHPGGGENGGNEEESNGASTMVINASNANSGRANRLVSGAVLVEIERRVVGDENAEDTIQYQRVDAYDGVLDTANGSSDVLSISELGEDLEEYVTKPGVRRRKGIPMSARQQMKNYRSTLVNTSEK